MTWQMLPLKNFGRIITGKTPPTARTELFGEAYPFITPTDIDGSQRKVTTSRFLSSEGERFQHTLLLPPKSVCVVCIGATIGKICFTDKPSFTNQQINSIVVNETEHDALFVYYALKLKSPDLIKLAGGAATPILNKSSFSEVKIGAPPLETQQKIAAILSAYDDLIENNTRRIQILDEMVRLIYEEWFVRFRFPGYESVELVESELGVVPEGWEIKKLGLLIRRLTAGNTYRDSDIGSEGDVIVVDQSTSEYLGFHNNQPDLHADPEHPIVIFGDHTCKLQIMTTSFSIGANTVPFVTNDDTPGYYLYNLIKGLVTTQEYKRHWTELNNKMVIKASSKLCVQYDEIVKPFFVAMDVYRSKNRKLRRMRDLLLPNLMSGEIDVSNFPEPE